MAALDSGWITTGPRVKRFEQAFSQRLDVPFAVALNSCTAALHLALCALELGPKDEVIVPTMTFAATGEVVRYFGAKPVLADIEPGDHNLRVEEVERLITPRTRAIIPVHFGGQSCEMDSLVNIARARGVAVVEDAAHAFPATYQDRPVGSQGDMACFSFYATKTITTGEGGMLTTRREDWAEQIRIMSLHGISKDAWKRYSAEGSWFYEIVAPGYKYNLTDMAAALGLIQLRRAEEMLAKRRRIARAYTDAFRACPALELLSVRHFDDHAWHLFVIKLVDGALRINRNEFIEELRKRGIGSSVHFIPLHMHPYYRETFHYAPDDLPIAHDVFLRSISLPIYSKMSVYSVNRVISNVLDLVAQHRR